MSGLMSWAEALESQDKTTGCARGTVDISLNQTAVCAGACTASTRTEKVVGSFEIS